MNKKDFRLAQIIQLMQEHGGRMSVSDLSRHLNVSDMTIRRDLAELQAHNLVERFHGKALLNKNHIGGNFQNIENDYALLDESEKHNEEKRRIGQYAATLIQEGDIIIIDSGSTTDHMVNFIPQDYRLTVACCNLNIVQKLCTHPNVDIMLAGGRLHQRDLMFESTEGIDFLRTIRANKSFISASGVHEKLGLTCAHNYEVISKQTMLQSAVEKILLIDSSKFGTVKTVFFASLPEIDIIVTDSGISPEWQEIITGHGIELRII